MDGGIDAVALRDRSIRKDMASLPRGTPKPSLEDLAFLRTVQKSIVLSQDDVGILFRDTRISDANLQKMLGMIGGRRNLVLYPRFIPPYTGLGYEVSHVITDSPFGAKIEHTPLLTIPDRNLPSQYARDSLNGLSRFYMSPENLKLMKAAGMELPSPEGDYDY